MVYKYNVKQGIGKDPEGVIYGVKILNLQLYAFCKN